MTTGQTATAGKAAVVGGGVIGGGWAARFLLHGWDVSIFDPDPEAERKIGEVLANARRSLPQLSDVKMPVEGTLTFETTIAATVTGAAWIQESVPEQLELKHHVFTEIQESMQKDAVIGSSTSCYTPTQLRGGSVKADFIVVAHPFNPVYLLPLVELVPGNTFSPSVVEKANAILGSIGMKVLVVNKEIDGHIADRLLEAVWREGLWLINDGIASTEEIDDAIRFGFGLRWAQMGLFETYRIAGGEAGMAHFIAQFGPTLSYPVTKLMDVPELNDELIKTISDQSDAQSAHYSIRELEKIRDDNLVGMMRVLKDRNWGAGSVLKQHEERLRNLLESSTFDVVDNKVLTTYEGTVLSSWIDYNGHMTEGRYLLICSDASDALLAFIGVDMEYVKGGHSYYTVETHIMHKGEAKLGESIRMTTQVLAADSKRLHIFHHIYAGDGRLAATGEQMLLHVDMNAGRACDADADVIIALQKVVAAHAQLPIPDDVGRCVGQRSQK